jgi:hypothetical protein
MAAPILNEQQGNQAKRDTMEMLQSPQGRRWGRVFLTERGKPNGNLGQAKREMLDILSTCINELYAAEAPKMSR